MIRRRIRGKKETCRGADITVTIFLVVNEPVQGVSLLLALLFLRFVRAFPACHKNEVHTYPGTTDASGRRTEEASIF